MADDDVVVTSEDGFDEEGKIPSAEEIFAALENTPGLDEAMKLELRNSLFSEGGEGIKKLLNPDAIKVDPVENSRQLIFLLILVSLVIMVLDSRLPTTEELLAALDRMSGLEDKMREDLRQGIIRGGSESVRNLIPPDSIPNENSNDILKLLGLVLLVLFVVVFFGYKLYTSLVERERRREEKKRQKQQKKKK